MESNKTPYYIYGVNGPVIHVRGGRSLPRMSLVYVGKQRLFGEVVSSQGDESVVQIYEDSGGLSSGEPVYPTMEPMSIRLGPGLVGGIQRVIVGGYAVPGQRMDQRRVSAKVIEDNEGHLDTLGIQTAGDDIIFRYHLRVEMPGFPIILVIDTASACDPSQQKIVGRLMNAEVSQVIGV